MKRIALDDIDHPPTMSSASVVRPLSGALGTDDVAVNYFGLVPGGTFGIDYLCHLDQEEVFYGQAGTATFRTEDGNVEVAAGEVVRFAPGEFQLGRNSGAERVRALALGAPRGSREIEYLRPCPDCGEETVQTPEVDREKGMVEIQCGDCGTVTDTFDFDR